MTRSRLVAACIRHRYAARRATDTVIRSAHWMRYFQARSALKRMPTRRSEVSVIVDRLLADANARKVDAPPGAAS